MSLGFVGADIPTWQGYIFAEAVAVLKHSVTLMQVSEFLRHPFTKRLSKWNIIAAHALLAGNIQVNICLLWLSKCNPSYGPENLHFTASFSEEMLSLFTFWFNLCFYNEYFNSFIFFVLCLYILWKCLFPSEIVLKNILVFLICSVSCFFKLHSSDPFS